MLLLSGNSNLVILYPLTLSFLFIFLYLSLFYLSLSTLPFHAPDRKPNIYDQRERDEENYAFLKNLFCLPSSLAGTGWVALHMYCHRPLSSEMHSPHK